MKALPGSIDGRDYKVNHYHLDGVYLREMPMKKGMVIVGKIHKTEHLCILSKGRVTVYNGEGRQELTEGAIVRSYPGVKRALYAHEDSIWVNIHSNPTNVKDDDAIDDAFVVETFEEFIKVCGPSSYLKELT